MDQQRRKQYRNTNLEGGNKSYCYKIEEGEITRPKGSLKCIRRAGWSISNIFHHHHQQHSHLNSFSTTIFNPHLFQQPAFLRTPILKMRFTSTFAVSAIAFLGASAAPGGPVPYGSGSQGGHPAPPAQSGIASGGTNPPPAGGSNPPAGGSTPAAPAPAAGSINCPAAQQVCCNSQGGSEGSITSPTNAPSASSSGILGGLLGGLLGGGLLNDVTGVLDLRSLLTCGVSAIGGACAQHTICCENTGPGVSSFLSLN